MTIRLGIIGSSSGNGHPYSWSAIFNGYDVEEMNKCEFPIIPDYLSKQSWPDARISGAKVCSIWTQDNDLSSRIAKASKIEHVSFSLKELEKRVDAVLLARDDAKNHLHYANIFLEAGKPIYIDKPIALSLADLNKLYALEKYTGQIFTCSALRYAQEFCLSPSDKLRLGDISSVSSFTPNSWEKYAVHIIEPVLKIMNLDEKIISSNLVIENQDRRSLSIIWEGGKKAQFHTLGNIISPIKINLKSHQASIELIFKDSFSAFKLALQDFVDGIVDGKCRSPFAFNAKVVDLLERGMK